MRTRAVSVLLAVMAAVITSQSLHAQAKLGIDPSRDGFRQEGGGHGEGVITVHGRWTVEIERDGIPIEKRQFDNALVPTGAVFLSTVLKRRRTVGPWVIVLMADDLSSLPICQSSGDGTCYLREFDGNVTVSNTEDDELILEGSVSVTRDAEIAAVQTITWSCRTSVAPSDCDGENRQHSLGFTMKQLESPIMVENGDTVKVTVDLGFE